ncbi:hypothetical protein LK12_13235 [Novosphingobium malaysiense]|uniref:Uncharacterized protein n=1 Tax=Novosphingobium malaysiense TaxID=1348853 RepID=A0A0B1ZRB0_9SPHN|nr:hypothetical protein LK12_13235 [Novosphingobium malaysiense]
MHIAGVNWAGRRSSDRPISYRPSSPCGSVRGPGRLRRSGCPAELSWACCCWPRVGPIRKFCWPLQWPAFSRISWPGCPRPPRLPTRLPTSSRLSLPWPWWGPSRPAGLHSPIRAQSGGLPLLPWCHPLPVLSPWSC